MLKLSLLFIAVFMATYSFGMPALDQDDVVVVGVSSSGEDNFSSDDNPRDVCTLPMKRGFCRAIMIRWMYNPAIKSCVEFKYGGCSGNANNFRSKKQCLSVCNGI